MSGPIQAILGALKYIPASVAQKALIKKNPKFKNFFASALSYGIDANRALDYLSHRFGDQGGEDYEDVLMSRQSEGMIRPDESASLRNIATSKLPYKAAKTGAALATGGLVGGLIEGLGGKSPQPEKGEEKAVSEREISDQFAGNAGQLPAQAQQSGISGQLPQQEPKSAQLPLDILAQYDPELARFVHGHVTNGRHPIEAGALAINAGKFKSPIKQIEKDVGMNFADFVHQIYGSPPGADVRSVMGASQPAASQPQSNPQMNQIMQGLAQLAGNIQSFRGKR